MEGIADNAGRAILLIILLITLPSAAAFNAYSNAYSNTADNPASRITAQTGDSCNTAIPIPPDEDYTTDTHWSQESNITYTPYPWHEQWWKISLDEIGLLSTYLYGRNNRNLEMSTYNSCYTQPICIGEKFPYSNTSIICENYTYSPGSYYIRIIDRIESETYTLSIRFEKNAGVCGDDNCNRHETVDNCPADCGKKHTYRLRFQITILQ